MFTSGPTTQNQLRQILRVTLFALGFVLGVMLRVVSDENLFYLAAAMRAVVGLEEFPQFELAG